MIPYKVGGIGLVLLGLRISVEVCDSHNVGVKLPQRNVFLFQRAVCRLFTCVSAHKNILLLIPVRSSKGHEEFQGDFVRCYDLH